MMKLSPKVLTGSLHPANKGACDWGWQGMLAHGCQSFVVIIDPKSVQNVQVLSGHKSYVTKLKWAHENYHHDIGSPYVLRLASADTTGSIIVWDVAQGYSKAEFGDGNRAVQDLQWVSGQDASRDLLVALHPPYTLIVWNADTGTKLWKKSYTESLLSFAFDPFDPKQVAFLGQDCIVFIHDFTITKVPSSNGKKFYISSPSSPGSQGNNAEKRESRTLAKRMSRILVGEVKQSSNKSDEESVNLNECIQLVYHQACRHHLILLYPRELLILDLEINQTVGTIPMERTGSPFTQVLSCRQRDALMCLHDNGSVTVRVRRKTNVICTPASEGTGAFDDTPPQVSLDVAYDLRCQSDPMRLTKHSKVLGVAMSPVTEKGVALIMSDSRVIFWEIKTISVMDTNGNNHAFSSPLYTPGASLTDFSQLTNTQSQSSTKLPILSDLPYPKLTMGDLIGQSQNTMSDSVAGRPKHTVVMKFLLTGLINGVTGHVSVIRMCPPLTTKNWSYYQPLLAIGTQAGFIQIYNLSSGQLDKEYSVHTSIIRGIEWVNLNSFLSFAFPNPGTNNLVKNEVMLVDAVSGNVTPVRRHKDEENPIEFIRVSCLKQYFAVCFKDRPFELWDMKSLTLLREMPKHFPHVTALEWSPSHAIKTLKRRLLQRHESTPTETREGPGAITDPSGSDSKTALKAPPKEHVIITDSESVVYHFIVEGSTITDSSKIPAEPGMAVINSIAWKADQIIFGDVEGHINIWDLKHKKSKYFPTNRGWVKKIRFAPGRGNMRFLALFSSGLEIWDALEGQSLYSIKTPKEMTRIIDAEWACSDKPVITTDEGCVRVMDLKLSTASSAIEERELPEPVFCPNLLSSKASLLLKCLLQHQPWHEQFTLKLQGMAENDKDLENSVNKQLDDLDRDIADYLPYCKFGTAHRSLLVARLFGDESETHFWTVALHYLRTTKISPLSKPPSRVSSQIESSTDILVNTSTGTENSDVKLSESDSERDLLSSSMVTEFRDQPLERCYDVLCDKESFQKYQLDRVALHDSKRATYEHTKKCAENYILLGQTDRAVQLLLETESENDSYYVDSLLACLVASIRSSGASQSTIKLVATNLIANGKLSEGVQLLCLIDKGLDACRYLQTYGMWHGAAWLAKASLHYSEYSEVMKRWADHLCGPHANQKSKAVLVMISLGQFFKVIEMLYGMRHFDRAVCFVEACMEFGLLEKTEETTPLLEAVFLEYARYLTNLRHRRAAEYYCGLAGDKGAQFLKEVEILFG